MNPVSFIFGAGLIATVALLMVESWLWKRVSPTWTRFVCRTPGPFLEPSEKAIPTGAFQSRDVVLIHDSDGIRARTTGSFVIRIEQARDGDHWHFDTRWGPLGVSVGGIGLAFVASSLFNDIAGVVFGAVLTAGLVFAAWRLRSAELVVAKQALDALIMDLETQTPTPNSSSSDP